MSNPRNSGSYTGPESPTPVIKNTPIEKDYKFVKILGTGAFSEVKLAISRHENVNVAIKCLDKSCIGRGSGYFVLDSAKNRELLAHLLTQPPLYS